MLCSHPHTRKTHEHVPSHKIIKSWEKKKPANQIQKIWQFGWPRKRVKFVKWTIYHICWECNWWTNLQSLACSSHNINRHWNLINLWLWIDWTVSQAVLSISQLAFLRRHLPFDDIPFELYLKRATPSPSPSSSTPSIPHHLHHHQHQHHRHQFVIFLWNIVLVLWHPSAKLEKSDFFLSFASFFDSIRIWSDFICLLMFRIKYVACERDEMRARQYCTWKSNDMSECVCVFVFVSMCLRRCIHRKLYICIFIVMYCT